MCTSQHEMCATQLSLLQEAIKVVLHLHAGACHVHFVYLCEVCATLKVLRLRRINVLFF